MAALTPASIGWGVYNNTEGPSFMGRVPYVVNTDSPTFNDKLLAITVAAEGGHYDAINMWDTGLCSVGLIQFIDVAPQFGVSNMLGAVADACGIEAVTGPLDAALKMSGATFKKNPSGQWRFFLDGGVTEVKTVAQQQRLFFNGPNTKGSFDASRKSYARVWAACMANVWENKKACQIQADFTVPRLGSFAFGQGRSVLLDPNDNPGEEGWVGAIKAFYMAYAINLPSRASQMVAQGAASSKFEKWSPQWCLDIMYCFVFNGKVDVWTARYGAKRPLLEKMFGITLPKDVATLAKREWHNVAPPPAIVPEKPPVERFVESIERPAAEVVVQRPPVLTHVQSTEDGMFLKALQWLPLVFGLFWRCVSWFLELFHKH